MMSREEIYNEFIHLAERLSFLERKKKEMDDITCQLNRVNDLLVIKKTRLLNESESLELKLFLSTTGHIYERGFNKEKNDLCDAMNFMKDRWNVLNGYYIRYYNRCFV
jgi:hypothetical protein